MQHKPVDGFQKGIRGQGKLCHAEAETMLSTQEALTLLMYSRGVRLKAGRSSVRVSPMPAVFQLWKETRRSDQQLATRQPQLHCDSTLRAVWPFLAESSMGRAHLEA